MVWTPKAGAPAYFRLPDAFQGMVMAPGSPVAWLLSWTPFLDPIIYATADFCATGPPPSVLPLDTSDFIGIGNPSIVDRALVTAHLGSRLNEIARDQLFGLYCETPAVVGGQWTPYTCIDIPAVASPTVQGPDNLVAVPSGAQYSQWQWTACTLHSWPGAPAQQLHVFHLNAGMGIVTHDQQLENFVGDDVTHQHGPPMGGAAFVDAFSKWGAAGRFCVRFWTTGAVPYTPVAEPAPPGALPPAARVYANIPDLGAELDRQELKLDFIEGQVRFLTSLQALGPTHADTPADAAAGPLINRKAVAFRIDVAGIPPAAGETFGTPQKFHRLGYVTIGSVNGWLESIDLEHNPLLISPLPAGVDRCQVVVYPPATATITALLPDK
jgi:hypothetical protein